MYRSSTGDLGYYDEPPRRPERWDRDRFERAGGGRRDFDEKESFHISERSRDGRNRHIDIEFDERERRDRRGPPVAERERERFYENDRFGPPRRHRTDLIDEPTASEVANRALAPYRRKSVVDREVDIAIRRPARPQYIRRQSSLDTFDRRPLPRYGDVEREERDEWRPPTNVPIPLPIRERRRSPERRRFHEEDYEEIRYRDYSPREREEYREVEVKREKSTHRRSRSRAGSHAGSRAGSKAAKSVAHSSARSSSSSSFEEVAAPVGRRGKTRMPKRLVKKQAVVEMGYPFEEEEDFIIVRRALEKEHIDELIKISESYKEAEKTTYVFEDNKTTIVDPPHEHHPQHEHHPPPPPSQHFPPPPPSQHFPPPPPPPPPADFYPPPPPASVAPSHHSHHPQHHSPSVRSPSPVSHHEMFEERIEESNHIGGPLTVLVPGHEERRIVRTERSDRDIKEEIRMLENERRLLKYEREGEYEVIERREPKREVVRVEKDRKGKRPPNPKLVAAMMSTLT